MKHQDDVQQAEVLSKARDFCAVTRREERGRRLCKEGSARETRAKGVSGAKRQPQSKQISRELLTGNTAARARATGSGKPRGKYLAKRERCEPCTRP